MIDVGLLRRSTAINKSKIITPAKTAIVTTHVVVDSIVRIVPVS
ncbi:unannotated protein [freshwater metagenome]|uniref:Unannotated protein n=1 Tax=freshwater metagenome TaxID=449393 RepID=A0A6J7TGH0_9ZZZZ